MPRRPTNRRRANSSSSCCAPSTAQLGRGNGRRHLRAGGGRRLSSPRPASTRSASSPTTSSSSTRPTGASSAAGRIRPPTERVRPDLLRSAPDPRRRQRRALPRAHRRACRRPRGRDGGDHLAISDLEMLKGIRGVTNGTSTSCRSSATRRASRARGAGRGDSCATPASRSPSAVLVADHGAYIWGDDVWEAKRHTEVYHFLFEAMVARPKPLNLKEARTWRSRAHDGTDDTTTTTFLCPNCQQRFRARRSTSSTSRRPSRPTSYRGRRLQADLSRPREEVQRLRLPGPRGSVPDARPHDATTRSATSWRAAAR